MIKSRSEFHRFISCIVRLIRAHQLPQMKPQILHIIIFETLLNVFNIQNTRMATQQMTTSPFRIPVPAYSLQIIFHQPVSVSFTNRLGMFQMKHFFNSLCIRPPASCSCLTDNCLFVFLNQFTGNHIQIHILSISLAYFPPEIGPV